MTKKMSDAMEEYLLDNHHHTRKAYTSILKETCPPCRAILCHATPEQRKKCTERLRIEVNKTYDRKKPKYDLFRHE